MKSDFLNDTPEELLQNREFVSWLIRGKNKQEWEHFLEKHPEFGTRIQKSKKIIGLLHDTQDHLSENEIAEIWKNIDLFDDQNKISARRIHLRRILQYAALVALVLLTGVPAGYWMLTKNHQTYVFSGNQTTEFPDQSRLLLSDGTTVELEKQNSKIILNSDQQIVIDNDRTIDLSQTANPEENKMNEVIIPFGKKSQLVLEDGTKVWLNAGSRMAFPTRFSGKKREVFLEGEAYFEVAHNQELPFLVHTGEIVVKVLGTRFNLSAYHSDLLVETTLLEGKVSLSECSGLGFRTNETILEPNQKASYDKVKQSISVKNEPDVEYAIAWTEGWIKFSQQSLNDVTNKIQRYYNVQFVFDPELSTTVQISGKMDLKESIEQVMTVLADVSNIHYRIDGKNIYLEKK